MNTLANQIEFLKGAYMGMDEIGSLRSYMSIGRDALGAEWFSARGILEKTTRDYRYFFKGFFTADNDNSLEKLFTPEQIIAFVNAIEGKINSLGDEEKVKFCDVAHKAINGNEILAGIRGGVKIEKKEVEIMKAVAAHNAAVVDAFNLSEVETMKPESIERKKDRTSANFSLMLPLKEMVDASVWDYLENETGLLKHVSSRITEEAAKLKPNFVKIGERKEVEIKGSLHVDFKETLELAMIEGQVFIAGPAGTGKTTLGAQVAVAMGTRFGHISCTAGMSEAHLLGRMDAHGNYLQSLFVDLFENGGVFLFDEVDAADSNTMLIINSALANGYLSVPNRKDQPTAKRHANFIALCAANTWGFGSNEYAGRNILDAAFLDRFAGSKIEVDYDTKLEAELSSAYPDIAVTMWQIRENVKKSRIRRVVSTRSIVSGVRAMTHGKTLKQYIKRFTTGWTQEEIRKALEGVN